MRDSPSFDRVSFPSTHMSLVALATRVKDALRGQIQAQVCRYAPDEAAARDEMVELLRLLAEGGGP